MAVVAAQPAVGTSAVRLTASDPDNQSVAIKNIGAVTVTIGGDSGVTAATGYPLAANEAISLDLYAGEAVWAVAPSATTVATIATGR